MSDKVGRIADKVAADWGARAAYATLDGEWAPGDLREAYRVQGAVQERLAARRGAVAGRKIALSSKAMQEMVGIAHPIAGAFFANDVRWSPAEGAAAEFRHLGVEVELAFELAQDVGPGAGPLDARGVRGLIAGVRPAFELVDDLGADYAAIDAFSLVAANAWVAGVVLGEPIPGWEGLEIGDLAATVYHETRGEGREPERTSTGAADPLASLAWVLNHFGTRGETVRRGEHVITGSAVRTRFPVSGDRLRYEIDGLAAVEAAVV
jgi:2-keto-4-pentenoate hydratase